MKKSIVGTLETDEMMYQETECNNFYLTNLAKV